MISEFLMGLVAWVGGLVLNVFDLLLGNFITGAWEDLEAYGFTWGELLGTYLGYVSDWVDGTVLVAAMVITTGGLAVRIGRTLIEVISRIIPGW